MTNVMTSEDLVRLHEDERQIRNLIARIAHLADYGDLDEYLTCFTEDAAWDYDHPHSVTGLGASDDARIRGAAALRADREHRRGTGAQGPGTQTRHVNTTLWIEVDRSDEATAHSYFLYVADNGSTPRIGLSGRYRDTLRRTATGWRLAHRTITIND